MINGISHIWSFLLTTIFTNTSAWRNMTLNQECNTLHLTHTQNTTLPGESSLFPWRGRRRQQQATELHINIMIQMFSFPRKKCSVTGNRRELTINAHTGLKHFSQFNCFSLLVAKTSNIALISGDLKLPRLPIKYQTYSFLSWLNTRHLCSCYELKIMFCLSSPHPVTPITTGLHFQFSFPCSPKYYNSDSHKEVQPQTAELSLRFQQELLDKQYNWLWSERKRILQILPSSSKDWRKPKYDVYAGSNCSD